MKEKLQWIIKKYETLAQVRTARFIEDLQAIVNEIDNKPIPNTPSDDVRDLYIKKYWSIPNRYKNDIQRLSSKL